MKTVDQLFFEQVLAESPEEISAEYVQNVINNMSQVEFLHRLSDALKEHGEQCVREILPCG